MKKIRFNEVQIVGILKQQEAGMKTAEVCREHGISTATFDRGSRSTVDLFLSLNPKSYLLVCGYRGESVTLMSQEKPSSSPVRPP